MNKVKKVGRKWLNPSDHEDTGLVAWYVKCRDKDSEWVDANLSIWDCYKKISLDFDCHATKDLEVRLKKLDLLEEAIAGVRAGLLKAYEREGKT